MSNQPSDPSHEPVPNPPETTHEDPAANGKTPEVAAVSVSSETPNADDQEKVAAAVEPSDAAPDPIPSPPQPAADASTDAVKANESLAVNPSDAAPAADATLSEATGSEATGSEATGSDAAGNEAAGNEAAGNDAAGNDDAARPKFAIGSQRDREEGADTPSQPKAIREAAAKELGIPPAAVIESDTPADAVPEAVSIPEKKTRVEKVPVPSKRQSSDDIEKELEAALGSVSMNDVIDKSQKEIGEEIEIEGRYKGTVTRIHKDDVFFSMKGRFEGVASARQFKKTPEVGTMTDVVVRGFNQEDGIYEVTIPGASVSVEDWSDIEVGSVVEVRVTGSNTGGLECQLNNIRGFIPASQIELHRVENLGDYVNKKLTCMVTEAKPKRKNLVLSHRRVLEGQMAEIRKETMAKLEPGTIVEGKVTRLREFGAFIDVGGIEGLAHISKLSWERIEKPDEVLKEGQQVKVKIEKVNLESGKISLSYRDTIEHPWDGIETKFPVDSVVQGKVTRLAQFGAFVRIAPGVEGLVHISELAHYRVVAVKNVVNEGDEVEVKVLSVDRGAQKIGLSLKAMTPVPEKTQNAKREEADEPHRELAVPTRRKKLKGGMDRRSGGDSFGLKW